MWNFIVERMKLFGTAYILDEGHRYSYAEVIDKAIQCGAQLKKHLKPKTKCAILCTGNYNTAIALLSCWYANMVPIPMSINYGMAHCAKINKTTTPTILICDDISIVNNCNICVFDFNKNQFLNEVVEQRSEEILSDVALIMSTSGTTGDPKGAMITEDGLIKNVRAIAEYFKIDSNDSILIARPLYHCAVLTGELLISLYQGLNISFINGSYNPIAVLDRIEKEQITVLCGTPTLFQHLSVYCKRMKKQNMLRVIAISGECLRKETAVQMREAFPDADIYNVYGLTEASPRVSYLAPALFEHIPESVGVALKGTLIRICDQNGNELKYNEHGMVYVKSQSIMKGYYNNQELTNSKIIDGWLVTGDIGYLDQNGYLYILSRADDMIIKAGMNIYPKEIENALEQLPMVSEVVAYGTTENNGQGIAVDIVLSEEYKNIAKKDLITAFPSVLPSYLLPGSVNIVEKLARNASGKIKRYKK